MKKSNPSGWRVASETHPETRVTTFVLVDRKGQKMSAGGWPSRKAAETALAAARKRKRG